jgi:hypothetical protein
MPVQAGACPVVANGGPRVGVAGGLLHVPQRHPGVEGGGDERVAERVRADVLGDPGVAGHPADDPGGAVPVQPPPVRGHEQRPCGPLAGRQLDRPGGPRGKRDGDHLAAFAGNDQRAVAALQAQVLDVGAGRFRDPQPVQCEQGDQGVLGGRAEPGGDQDRAELVAVQGGGMRLVIQSRLADVRRGRVLQEFFFDGVLVEPGDGAQPPGDGRTGAAACFQVAGEDLDVRAAD